MKLTRLVRQLRICGAIFQNNFPVKMVVFFTLVFLACCSNEYSKLEGVWYHGSSGTDKNNGYFEYHGLLIFNGRNFTEKRSKVSELEMYWEEGERGTIVIEGDEIQFTVTERKRQFDD